MQQFGSDNNYANSGGANVNQGQKIHERISFARGQRRRELGATNKIES